VSTASAASSRTNCAFTARSRGIAKALSFFVMHRLRMDSELFGWDRAWVQA